MGNSVNSYEMSVSQDEISSNYLGDWDTPDSLNSHSEPTTLTPAIQPPHLGGYPRNGGTAPFKELSPVSLRTRSKIAVKGNTANSSVSVVGGNVRRTPPPPATSLSASSSSDFSDDSSLSPAYAKGASKGASQSSPFSYDCDYNNTVLKTVRIGDKLCHVVDEAAGIFAFRLLSEKQCDSIIKIAEQHVKTSKGSNWRKLYTYTKADLPCSEVKELKLIAKTLEKSINQTIADFYGHTDYTTLHPRTWKEPHLLKYDVTGELKTPHKGVEMHYDGCDVTWQIMLSKADDYVGGGTFFRGIKKTVKIDAGWVLVHPGELFHKGVDITQGMRYLLVCFTDGMPLDIKDDSTGGDEECEKYLDNIVRV